jgi:hypothetical protein
MQFLATFAYRLLVQFTIARVSDFHIRSTRVVFEGMGLKPEEDH